MGGIIIDCIRGKAVGNFGIELILIRLFHRDFLIAFNNALVARKFDDWVIPIGTATPIIYLGSPTEITAVNDILRDLLNLTSRAG